MERTQIYVPGEHLDALRREAGELGISMTALVRRLVSDHVEGRSGVSTYRKEAVLAFVALGSSGDPDGSEQVDRLVAETLGAQALR